MSYKKIFAIKFKSSRLMKNFDIKLLFEIAIHPHIMIANKKFYDNTIIRKLGKFPQNSYKSFRNHFFVFVPEIKKITKDKYVRRFIFYFIKKPDDSFFSF